MTARLEPAHGSPHFPRPLERSRDVPVAAEEVRTGSARVEVASGMEEAAMLVDRPDDLVTNAGFDQRFERSSGSS